MAVITLIVADRDLEEGTFTVDFKVTPTSLDDGRATAAQFTGLYLQSLVNTPEFTAGVENFGHQLVEAMQEDQVREQTKVPATMTLTLTDKDLNSGRYAVGLASSGGDESGEMLPTTAQIVGGYMRALLNKSEFRDACWAFAEEFAANHKAAKTPASIPSNDDAASIAA